MWKENAKYAKLGKLTPLQRADARSRHSTWWMHFSFCRFLRWSLNVMMSIRAIFGVRRVFFSKKSPLSKASLREKSPHVTSPKWQAYVKIVPKMESCWPTTNTPNHQGPKLWGENSQPAFVCWRLLLLKFNFVMEKKPDKHKKTWFVQRYKTVE